MEPLEIFLEPGFQIPGSERFFFTRSKKHWTTGARETQSRWRLNTASAATRNGASKNDASDATPAAEISGVIGARKFGVCCASYEKGEALSQMTFEEERRTPLFPSRMIST